jgi:hypothetical protein
MLKLVLMVKIFRKMSMSNIFTLLFLYLIMKVLEYTNRLSYTTFEFL